MSKKAFNAHISCKTTFLALLEAYTAAFWHTDMTKYLTLLHTRTRDCQDLKARDTHVMKFV